MPPLALCAVTDDDQLRGVVAAGRHLQAANAFTPRFIHVDPLAAWSAPARPTFLDAAGLSPDAVEVTCGSLVPTLERRADQLGAALFVIGNRRRGALSGAFTSSVSRALLRHATRPVLMTRGERTAIQGSGPVICGIAPRAQDPGRVARAAAGLARRLERPLVLASVVDGDAESRDALEVLDRVATWLDAPHGMDVVVVRGGAATGLAEVGELAGASCLVVGSGGAGVLGTLLGGDVSLALLRHAQRSVVVVPPARAGEAGAGAAH
jgi:nucleotide-binding universal stress UspA family protein